jgi:hypothetical protein
MPAADADGIKIPVSKSTAIALIALIPLIDFAPFRSGRFGKETNLQLPPKTIQGEFQNPQIVKTSLTPGGSVNT